MKAFFDTSVLVPVFYGDHDRHDPSTAVFKRYDRKQDTLRERLTIVALTEEDYYQCIQENAARGVVGGTIYDALLAHCALKAKAESIYSWNIRHYQLLGPAVAKRLRTP